jgi:UDP-glucuronate 4-epimerase
MKHVLVTGGAGFIGSHLVEKLLAEDCRVTAIDNFDPFYDRSLKCRNLAASQNHPRFRLIEADIRDAAGLRANLKDEYDVIVHLAAKAGVRPSLENPIGYQEVNVAGTQNLLEWARERRLKKFVFASSSSVYGINPKVPWREDDHVLLPISPYASTKVSGELLGHAYSYLYGIRFVALRFFTVYGPRQRPDLAINKFTRLMLQGAPIPVYGNGTSRRDYTYIDDILRGICAAIDYTRTPYEVINLGNNNTVTLSRMIDTLQKVTGREAIVDRRPDQPGDVPQTYADLAKAKALLGYEPQVDFETGISCFYEWFEDAMRPSYALGLGSLPGYQRI